MKNNIKPKALVAKIAEDIEKKILRGILKPGQRIIEWELCKEYKISQSPVREALRVLESQGYVIREQWKGVSVTKVTVEDLKEIYLIRAYLQSLAVYLAVQKQNSVVIKKLKKLHEEMIKAEARGDGIEYFNLNLRFHETLVKACESERIINLIQAFEKQTKRFRINPHQLPGMMKKSIESHEKIIKSFMAGDARRAEQVTKETTGENIPLYLEQFSRGEGRDKNLP